MGDFESFVDQATPRFELGKKDLQSPALPLGHVAKTKKVYKIDENTPRGGLTNFSFFYCTCTVNRLLLNPFTEPYTF